MSLENHSRSQKKHRTISSYDIERARITTSLDVFPEEAGNLSSGCVKGGELSAAFFPLIEGDALFKLSCSGYPPKLMKEYSQ